MSSVISTLSIHNGNFIEVISLIGEQIQMSFKYHFDIRSLRANQRDYNQLIHVQRRTLYENYIFDENWWNCTILIGVLSLRREWEFMRRALNFRWNATVNHLQAHRDIFPCGFWYFYKFRVKLLIYWDSP